VIKNRRTLAYVAIALIVGAALALAVALAFGGGTTPSSTSSTGVQARTSPTLLGETGATGSTSSDPLSADPAKEEPLLDKFVSKNPFVPLGTTNSTGSGGSGTSTANLTAKIEVNGTSYSVVKGDKVPGGNPVFEVSSITSGDVTFTILKGAAEGSPTSVTVTSGETVKVPMANGTSYKLHVVSIGKSGGGGTSGHTISVLSVSESNNTALATIEVDGKTYSDKKVGDVFSTSWGDIKVIAINVNAQTVTLMHGDQTITLRAGQVVVK
jgi:hypothetical protein